MAEAVELHINKEINAPIERVFQAWVQAEKIKHWFAPGKVMTVPRAEIDLQEGGSYLIHMHNPEENEDYIVTGTYEEIIPNQRLVFTWGWQHSEERTKVAIELKKINENKTMLTLMHTGFVEQASADKHNMGWNGCIVNLENYLL